MKQNTLRFRIVDALYLLMMFVPILTGLVLKALTAAPADGVVIEGAMIYFTIPMPFQNLPITEAQVNSWLVVIFIFGLCLFLTHGMQEKACTVRQHVVEWLVEKSEGMVQTSMGSFFLSFAPFVGAILSLSVCSSLLSLFGLFAPTSDLSVVAGWAILVFIVITVAKGICGPKIYLSSFGDPVPAIAPLNLISELATPISMAFRHYGNVMSGSVIAVLVGAGLKKLSLSLLGWLPGVLGTVPFLRIGLPAILSIYFDVFSGCLQAYIFAMLTMLYVGGGFPLEEYQRRRDKKNRRMGEATV